MSEMAVKMVADYFEAQQFKIQYIREDVIHGFWEFEGGSIEIYLKFSDDDSYVHVEGYRFLKIPQSKFDLIYKVLNECNDTYKFVKFVLDMENEELNARIDSMIQLDSCGPECHELVGRIVAVVQDSYPKFMKALWT